MTGFLASSKAGHDKDTIYVIIKEDTEYVWLADGRIKTISKPKKKCKRHIQIIKYFNNEEIQAKLLEGKEVSDLEIMMIL
ncbi:MAG: KOW domain-containing RNA-binding protein, partial [Lachnospiraceae bacterium]|nr:KOW domain-containing RNA-binding protein [Lachnospiraceae bacterium]